MTMTTTKAVELPPKIQQQPKSADANAVHYGYVAFKDIELGVDPHYKVQPPNSPYYSTLPCRQLIPFTNFPVAMQNSHYYVDPVSGKSTDPPTVIHQRTAQECARIMEIAYNEWGYVTLEPLTAVDEETAFAIFSTIQPFVYKLRDIEYELTTGAEQRIHQTEPYNVTYMGDTIENVMPLRGDQIDTALETARLMAISASVGVKKAETVKSETEQKLTSYFAGNEMGKKKSDPLDAYVFAELDAKIPQLLAGETPQSAMDATLQKLASLIVGAKSGETDDDVVAAKDAEIAELKAQLAAQMAEAQEPEPVQVEKPPTEATGAKKKK